ncbi:secretin N-terminal domain-containing protein [Photobacterium indicum]|uniref:secretin N-terminal domain-containing protein n=1 Tax=Photobacterium indicum TaxID=81447 RepID=UPI003D148454
MKRFFFLVALVLALPVNAKLIDGFEAHNMPITEFVDWYSDALKLNVIVDDGVKGAVSFSAPELDTNDFQPFVDAVLVSNGFKMTPDDGFYRLSLVGISDSNKDEKLVIVPPVTKFYDLNYVENVKISDLIQSVLTAYSKNTGEMQTAYSVITLPNINSMIVTGSPSQLTQVDNLITRVDVRRKQVLIDAVVMDTRLGDSESIGVSLDVLLEGAGFRLISNPVASIKETFKGGNIIYDKGDVSALVTAITQNQNTKLLSKPYLLVMDREKGSINVGQNVPFLVSTETSNNGSLVQKIERQNVGLGLIVVPHIVNDSVVLTINQTSSSVSDSDIASDIITNNREINTVVQVLDGQSIILGGLVSDESRQSESGVPLLKDIPWIGGLFRTTSDKSVSSQMSVLIKVTVI